MKIFVTGATGFIGRNLTERLVEEGHDVICGVRSPAKLGPLKDKVRSYRIYLEYKDTILQVLRIEKPDLVYHCAALVKSSNIEHLRRVNKDGTRNVLEACLAEGIERIVYVSTIAVVNGNDSVPLTEDLPYKANNSYGQSKLEAEKIAVDYRKKGLKIAILRPCMVYGEGEPHALDLFVSSIRKRILPCFGNGTNKLHLVSVENVVDVLMLCLTKEKAYEGTYFVADKEVLSAKEVLNFIVETLGAKPPFVISQGVALFLSSLPFIGKYPGSFLKDRVYSIDALKKRLGYVPRISIYDGLKRAVLACKK